MDVTGSGAIKFSGVTVSTAGCGVTGGSVETQELKITILSPTKAILEPVSGALIAEFNFVNSGGSCPLTPNNPIKVEGHSAGSMNGARLTVETVAGELHIGAQVVTLIRQ